MAIFAATLEGRVTSEEIDAVEGLPPSKFPRELMVKLGYNPPLTGTPESAPLQPDNTPPEDSVEKAWAALKAKGYPKQDSDPATGETFPVFPENVMEDEEHPLYYSLPDNARPETWRELDSAAYNPSKARTIWDQPVDEQAPVTDERIDAAIVVAIHSGTIGEKELATIRRTSKSEWPASLWMSLGLPAPEDAPISARVEISTQGTFHHITEDHDNHPYEGEEHVRFTKIEVNVFAEDTDMEDGYRLLESALFTAKDGTLGEHAALPLIPWRGVIDEVGCAGRMKREILIKPHEDMTIRLAARGISIGTHMITWSEVTESGGLDCFYDLTAYWDGEELGEALTSVLYSGNEKSRHPMRGILLALMDQIGFLSDYSTTTVYDHSPAQAINAAGNDPDVLLELAKSLPWERACQLPGPPELAGWLKENHPEHQSRPSGDSSPSEVNGNDGSHQDDQDSEWPPDRFRILCAMRARRMAGTMTSKDVERMDEGPPETWPDDLWNLLGFVPPLQRR